MAFAWDCLRSGGRGLRPGAWLLRDACAERRRPLGPGSQSFLSAAKAGIGGLAATSLAEPAPRPAPGSPFSSPPLPVSRGPGALPRRSPSPCCGRGRVRAPGVGGVVGAHHCAPRPRGLHGRILWPRGLGARRREMVVGSGPCPGVAPWSRVKRTVSKRARLGWFVPPTACRGPRNPRHDDDTCMHPGSNVLFRHRNRGPGEGMDVRAADGPACQLKVPGVPGAPASPPRPCGAGERDQGGPPEAHPRFCHSHAGPRASTHPPTQPGTYWYRDEEK